MNDAAAMQSRDRTWATELQPRTRLTAAASLAFEPDVVVVDARHPDAVPKVYEQPGREEVEVSMLLHRPCVEVVDVRRRLRRRGVVVAVSASCDRLMDPVPHVLRSQIGDGVVAPGYQVET